MMTDPLEGCRAKIERAKEHFRNLNAEVGSFVNLGPYEVVGYDNSQTGERVLLARVSRQPPLHWGVIAGEIVHHLRSTLDHLVWQLVRDNGGTPGPWTEFPVVWNPDDWNSKKYKAEGRGKEKGVSKEAMRYIERLQPYNGPDGVERHPLYILHCLDIRDKHQVINLAVGAYREGDVTTVRRSEENISIRTFVLGGAGMISPLKDSTEIFRLSPEEITPDMDMQGQFTFSIAFEQGGPAKGERLTETLKELIEFVDWLITLFRPLFQHSPPT